MAIKFEKITAGMTLLDVHRTGVGNTTMREWGCWKVQVLSVDAVKRTARVSWNGNPPEIYDEDRLKKLYTKEPKSIRDQRERRARYTR